MPKVQERNLGSRIRDFEFCPEIYMYPTPRMYDPIEDFSFENLELTEQINVYVHVPFCKQFCTFCGYFKTIYKENLQAQFVDVLVKEIALRASSLRGKEIKTLHFGGGTPSLLSPEQLHKIVEALKQENPEILKTCLEVSIEATPESIEFEKFEAYHRAGINRVSMGVQSLVDSEVLLANRCVEMTRSSFQMLSDALADLRKIGIPDVVIDLMIGIEGQTVATFEQTVKQALTLRPDTVQLYALGIMPRTALGRRKPPELMPGPMIYECYEIGCSLFTEAGYRRDSHDRYTLRESNGFLQGDYNIQGMSLVGLGAGARSYAKTVNFRNTFTSNNGKKALEVYMQNINEGRHSVESAVYLNEDELSRQYAIGHIQAIDEEYFRERFALRFQDKFPELYQDMMALDLMRREDGFLKLTSQGLLFRDLLGREMFSEESNARESAYR